MADQMVLAARRRELILETVRLTGGIRVAELVDRLGVSSVTVRRDLEALVRQGAVRKVHGGAMAVGATGPGEAGPAPEPGPAGIEAALAWARARARAEGGACRDPVVLRRGRTYRL